MASILRSSKFVRYIAGFAKNVVVNTPREFDGTLVNTTQCFCGALPRALATQAQASGHHDQTLEKNLRRIDQDVRKSGRISRRDIEDVLEDIRNARTATSSQSLLVIRCCGNLVPEELPEVRTKLVQEIWNTLHKLNVPMDVSHYNALLRVYLENEFEFSPTDFLNNLESKGIEPNRVTYQRLIARYCQVGNIDGATKILEYMREKQLPVNENVFNALIVGHSQADDMESAYGILSVMTQAGLEPSADTYTTLLCGYAKKGSMSDITKIFDECELKEVFLLDKDYLDIIYSLAVNGHAQHVPEILNKVRRAIGYNQDAINLILRLVIKGQDEAAFLVLKSMTRGSRSDGTPSPTGHFFVKQLIKANRPFETVLSLCRKLEAEDMYDRALLLAAETSLELGNDKLAYPLLEELQKGGTEVRTHYFWPLIMSKNNDKDIVDVLNKMRDFNVTPNSETIRDYVIPKLKGKSTDILATLRDANVSLGSSACSLVLSLLQRNEIAEAAVIAGRVAAYYNPEFIKRPLTVAFYRTKDIENYITLLRVVYDNLERKQQMEGDQVPHDKDEVVGEFLIDLANNKSAFQENIERVLGEVVKQGLSISSSSAQKIEEKLGEKMTEAISDLLGKLTSGDLTPIPVERKAPTYTPSHQMNPAQLERLIANLEAKKQETLGLKRQLLMLYYRSKDLEKTEALIKSLSGEEKFVFSSGVYAQLMDIYASHDKADEAMEYFRKLGEMESENFKIDELKVVRLAQALVKNGRLDEAIGILENTATDKKNEEHGFPFTSCMWRMLNSLAEAGKTEDLDRLFDVLVKKEYMEPNNILLGPLIKVHIVNNDIDKALEKFEWCVNQFKATPWKNELACKLINSEDAEKLQKLTDLSTSVHGEINSLYDLVFAFVECGRVRQARKILETPGLQSRHQRINTACERYRNEGMLTPLEGLRDATKDLNHIDRSDIYYQLLLSYIKTDEPEKALGLWTQMQEEDLPPSEQFLRTLGGFLKRKNLQVPFAVPAGREQSRQRKPQAQAAPVAAREVTKTPQQILRQKLKVGEIDGALDIYKRSADKFAIADVSSLIEKLTQNDRVTDAKNITLELLDKGSIPVNRVFRFLLNKLAAAGDLETLNLIGTKISQEAKRLVSFDNRICHANLVAGKAEEYLQHLEKEIDNASEKDVASISEKFPRGGAYGILERNPELIEKYETVAIKYAKKNIVAPLNVLWTHYFIQGNFDKASQVWRDFLQNSPRIMFQRIVQTAREKQDEDLTKKLIEHLKISNVTEGAIGNAYSCLLDILHQKNKEDELVNAFEAAIKDIKIESLNRTAIFRVKEVYDKLGKPFNHTIPPKVTKTGTIDSSSSSSDDKAKKVNK
ncbi:unnamed protein product [Brassicogethes aeneus]|uniref:Leucine-rich PPR motif-containing protein, mitochondrial n=1 Tax=Brassicogethes aeneus TaxID=1431903 RepID=A0A9P0FL78_BRAAE|nr:unnamed protein product [Brassicogethes aeneus]